MSVILMALAAAAAVVSALMADRALKYWMRRISVGTLYLQWSNGR